MAEETTKGNAVKKTEVKTKSHVRHFLRYGMTACRMPTPPAMWPENHSWSSAWSETTCPECLKGKEPIDTFTISEDQKSITCNRCKFTSYNPNDVEQHFCSRCKVFHDDIWPPARLSWINESPSLSPKILVIVDKDYGIVVVRYDDERGKQAADLLARQPFVRSTYLIDVNDPSLDQAKPRD